MRGHHLTTILQLNALIFSQAFEESTV